LLLISIDSWENRAVLLESGKITEFYAERRKEKARVNSIFLGKVKSYNPSLNSYFVNIGHSRNAFLSAEKGIYPETSKEWGAGLKKDDEVLVQLQKPPYKSKGARVSLNISLPGHYLVYFPNVRERFVSISRKISQETAEEMKTVLSDMIQENCGVVVRTAAVEADYEQILSEFEYLRSKWQQVKALAQKKSAPALIYTDDCFAVRVVREAYRKEVESVYVDDENALHEIEKYAEKFIPELRKKLIFYRDEKPLFERFAVEHSLKEVFSRTVSLPSGGYLVIDKREAMTVIDVNSGRFTKDLSHEKMALRINLQAAQEIARQIRLRNLSGIILVDFIDMRSEDARKELYDSFSELLEKDRAYLNYEFVPSMSLFVVTRKHMANVSASFFEEECSLCHGSGWVPSSSSIGIGLLRRIIKTASKKDASAMVFRINTRILLAIKEELPEAIVEAEKLCRKKIYLLGSDDMPEDDFEIVLIGEDELIRKHFPKKIMFTK
jgi:ribonuclease G